MDQTTYDPAASVHPLPPLVISPDDFVHNGDEMSTPPPTYGILPLCTVAYNAASIIEHAIAILAVGSQPIPLIPRAHAKSELAGAIPFVTPEVVLFGVDYTSDDIARLLARGFQRITIFAAARDVGALRALACDRVDVADIISVFDIVTFKPTAAYVLDLIMCAVMGKYYVSFAKHTVQQANYFLRALGLQEGSFSTKLLGLLTITGFDTIAQLILAGECVTREERRFAHARLCCGYARVLGDARAWMVNTVASNIMCDTIENIDATVNDDIKKCQHVICYNVDTDPNSWNVTIVRITGTAGAPETLLPAATPFEARGPNSIVAKLPGSAILAFLGLDSKN